MASVATQVRHHARRYTLLIDQARILNRDFWPDQKAVMRHALSNSPAPENAHAMTVAVKRMNRQVADFDAGTKMRILWSAYAQGDNAPLFHDDDYAGAFNDQFFARPLRSLSRGMSAVDKALLRSQLERDTVVGEWDTKSLDALDAMFSDGPDRSFSLEQAPAVATDPH